MKTRSQVLCRASTVCLGILLALLLNGCLPASAPPAGTLPPPSTAAPAPAEAPWLIYVVGNELFEHRPGETARPLGTLPNAGAVLAAQRTGDAAWVLQTQGVARISLREGTVQEAARFPEEALFGSLFPLEGGVLYQATFSDPQAEFGLRTLIGTCRPEGHRTILSSGENLELLGLTPDGEGLYLLPRGQDPAYGELRIVSLRDGTLRRALPVEGEGPAFLSPGGHYLVCPVPGALHLYGDLSADSPARHEIALPHAPSYLASLLWREEGLAVLSLLGGDPYTLEPDGSPALGLLRLDVTSPALAPLTTGEAHERRLLALTPDGRWLATTDLAGAIQIWEADSGRLVRSAPVPAGDAYAPALSADGRWLLVRVRGEEEAAAVRIPEGEVVRFLLPPDAVVVGWR